MQYFSCVSLNQLDVFVSKGVLFLARCCVCWLAPVKFVACLGTSYLLPYCATFCWKFDVGIGDMKIKVFLINRVPLLSLIFLLLVSSTVLLSVSSESDLIFISL